MCLAIPSRIIELDGLHARVECFGRQREVNLILMPEQVALGDYLLVQAGGFAYERVEEARALEALALMAEVVGTAQACGSGTLAAKAAFVPATGLLQEGGRG